jgi:RNA polymerase sigma factor (sigma-70 family)
MPTSQISEVIQHLRKTVLLLDEPGLTDGQLLGRFIEHRDEAAFAALVQRHGPMVWGVCRRILHNHHDAEDAFQATFLVLVSKAASVLPRELVPNWLYGVAHQTALKARATAAKRRARVRQVTEMAEPAIEQDLWDDLQPLLDQELSRLPDKFRAAIVLCDLEGKTRKEAARQLGCPEGTVASRLATARALLAKRLARHGLAVSGGALAAVVAQQAASAGVPISVMISTIKAVTLVAAGQAGAGVISAHVAALTEGMVKTMLLMKLKAAGAVLLILGMVALGGGLFTRPTEAAQQEGVKATKSKADQPKVASSPQAVRSVEQPKLDGLPAKEILERMVKAYTNCKSYRDSGLVKTLFVENGGNRTVEKPFTTAFVRPDRFRFEYRETTGDRQMRFIIWSNGKKVQTWWDVQPGIDKPESLALALGSAAGVSGLSSLNIPQLLLPDQMGWSRLALTEPKRARDGKLGKVDCFRVEGKYGGNPITLWIDKQTYLVRRIDEQAKFDNFRTEQTTTYDPAIDGKLTDKMLAFDPPAPK